MRVTWTCLFLHAVVFIVLLPATVAQSEPVPPTAVIVSEDFEPMQEQWQPASSAGSPIWSVMGGIYRTRGAGNQISVITSYRGLGPADPPTQTRGERLAEEAAGREDAGERGRARSARQGGRTAWRHVCQGEKERNGSRRFGQAHGCAQETTHEFFRIIFVASLTCRARRSPCRRTRLTVFHVVREDLIVKAGAGTHI